MNTPHTPASPVLTPYARDIAAAFGSIANTTEWNLPSWQALMVRIEALALPVEQLTLGQILSAIDATDGQLHTEVDA